MKYKNILTMTIASLTLVVAGFGPTSVSANSHALNLAVLGNADVMNSVRVYDDNTKADNDARFESVGKYTIISYDR